MSRWIDTLTDLDITNLVEHLADVNVSVEEVKQELEKLFAPPPHWTDNLDVSDSSTWVLCWVSDKSASSTCQARWIYKVNSDGSYGGNWHKYATPVDLNLRYVNGEDTL
mgnify:CR=1 FL=1